MAEKKSLLRRLLGGIWRTVVVFYMLLFLVLVIAVPVAVYVLFFSAPEIEVPQHSVLIWEPNGQLVASRDRDDNVIAGLLAQPRPVSVVRNLTRVLERAATDDRIELVLLKLDRLGEAQPGQLEELGRAIRDFKESGKPVLAWAPDYNQDQYYLASFADTIYLDPLGQVYLKGYGVFRNYFADALEMLDIEVNVFRVGKYKSFVEPFIRNSMSPEARANNLAWLNSLWSDYKKRVAAARGMTPEAIDQYIMGFAERLAAMGGDAAQLAAQAGLVDKVAPLGVLQVQLREQLGGKSYGADFPRIDDLDYLAATADQEHRKGASQIVLLPVEGPIIDGESVTGAAGSKTIVEQIERARRDDHVAAMVMRINSPGGSVTAAEQIRRQVERMREQGKPVVVSMSGVAASGGYWIGMNANEIWAERTTLTGSIGVFGIVPTFGKILNDLGISSDGVGTTPLAGALQLDEPLSEDAKTMLQAGVEHIYRLFVGGIATARGMDVEAVDKIAGGRVWSGADAADIGLVDELGGLGEAATAAAAAAGLGPDDYVLVQERSPTSWRTLVRRLLTVRLGQALLPDWLHGLVAAQARDWRQLHFDDPRGLYARCFCQVRAAPAFGP